MTKLSTFSLIICLTTTLASSYTKTLAQAPVAAMFEASEKVNGNELIEKLVEQKREFNKARNGATFIKLNRLPNPEYIFNRKKLTTINFDGVDYLVQDNQVIAVKGLNLSESALAKITAKFAFLDQVQYAYAEKANQEYLYANGDQQNIRIMDKSFLLSLRILSTTVGDIAAFVKKPYASQSMEANLVKMPQPNIDMAQKRIPQAIVGLAK